MELKDAIMNRRSVRGYKDTPVSKELLREVLEVASRAVSGKNTQSWKFTVVSGAPLEEIKNMNSKLFKEGAPFDEATDYDLTGDYKERAKVVGINLFKLMEIGREDKEKRMWWSERGFRFFDAPAAILISMDDDQPNEICRLDIGCVIQNICLAAEDAGLATCVEYQAVSYNKHYYDILNVPKNQHFICGIAIGYEDPSFAANSYISEREDVDTMTNWVGF